MTNSTPNLKKAFLKGSAWNILGMGAGQLLRFGKNLLLTRLLFPEAYGVMSIIWAVLFAISMLSDAGFEAAAIRHARGDQKQFLDSVWTAKIMRGILLFFITCLIAYPISRIYGKPELFWLLPISGITVLLDGFGSTNIYLLKRQMEYRILTYVEVSNEILMAIVTISWAYLAPGYMALLGGAIFGSIFHLIASHAILPGHKNTITWDKETLKDLFHFGKWILMSSSIYLIYSQGDRMLLGLYVDSATLGIYSVALMMSEVIASLASRLNGAVVYTTLNRVQHEGREKIKSILYKIRFGLDIGFIFPIGILFVLSKTIIHILYDSRYHGAGDILQILCIRLVMITMLLGSESSLLVLGKSKYSLFQNAGRATWLVIGLPLGFHFFGLTGAILAIATTDIASAMVLWPALIKEKIFAPLLELRSLAFAAAGFGAGSALLQLLQSLNFPVVR
jgi:O-antigen/teichoic acid export membrane protein